MSRPFVLMVAAAVSILGGAAQAHAQLAIPYGMSINLETAKKAAAPAIAEARKNNWTVAVAIVDVGGDLVYFERIDATQNGSIVLAIQKAQSAVSWKRPTKAFQDALATGAENLRVLRYEGAAPVEGGIPLVMEGKIIGGIGVSGATAAQDGQVAGAGAAVIK